MRRRNTSYRVFPKASLVVLRARSPSWGTLFARKSLLRTWRVNYLAWYGLPVDVADVGQKTTERWPPAFSVDDEVSSPMRKKTNKQNQFLCSSGRRRSADPSTIGTPSRAALQRRAGCLYTERGVESLADTEIAGASGPPPKESCLPAGEPELRHPDGCCGRRALPRTALPPFWTFFFVVVAIFLFPGAFVVVPFVSVLFSRWTTPTLVLPSPVLRFRSA